jgi:hypothetical protein
LDKRKEICSKYHQFQHKPKKLYGEATAYYTLNKVWKWRMRLSNKASAFVLCGIANYLNLVLNVLNSLSSTYIFQDLGCLIIFRKFSRTAVYGGCVDCHKEGFLALIDFDIMKNGGERVTRQDRGRASLSEPHLPITNHTDPTTNHHHKTNLALQRNDVRWPKRPQTTNHNISRINDILQQPHKPHQKHAPK